MPAEIEFEKYGIDEVKGGSTYVLKMQMPEKAPGATFVVGMPDVTIVVDGKSYKSDAVGGLDLPLKKGKHTFVVSMKGYKSYQGSFEIDNLPVVKQIVMQRGDGMMDKGVLTITYPLNAEFTITPINDAAQPVKKKIMTGEQIALNGIYQVSFEKKKYKSQTMTVLVEPDKEVRRAFANVALDADDHLMSNDFTKAFKDYKKLADKGDDLAQYKVGCCFYEGKGTVPNASSAISYWMKAAAHGNMDACRKLLMVTSDEASKKEWLLKLADNGDVDAMMQLANSSKCNAKVQWLQKASDLKSPLAYFELGQMYYDGEGIQQNYTRAYRYFTLAASYEYPKAKERILDYTYFGLDNQEADKKKAVEGYEKMGDNLSDDGKCKVGMYYYEEYEKNNNNSIMLSLAKNYFEKLDPTLKGVHYTAKTQDVFLRLAKSEAQNNAVFYYMLCESAGVKNATVYNALGNAYRLGRAVNANPTRAYQYYRMSSDMGDRNGTCWLGFCYEKGIGVSKNLEEAVRLYQRAMDMGSTIAAGYLGTMYAQGVAGLPKDRDKAVSLWTMSANDNNVSSVRNLIKHYQMKKNAGKVQYWKNKLNKIQERK